MKVVSDWDNPIGANYSQFDNKSSFKNATGGWEEWFDKITGTGQEVLGTAQNIKDQFTGNVPIDQGEIGDGFGQWQANSGVNSNQSGRSTSPLIWGLIIVAGVGTIYFIASAFLGKSTKVVSNK